MRKRPFYVYAYLKTIKIKNKLGQPRGRAKISSEDFFSAQLKAQQTHFPEYSPNPPGPHPGKEPLPGTVPVTPLLEGLAWWGQLCQGQPGWPFSVYFPECRRLPGGVQTLSGSWMAPARTFCPTPEASRALHADTECSPRRVAFDPERQVPLLTRGIELGEAWHFLGT